MVVHVPAYSSPIYDGADLSSPNAQWDVTLSNYTGLRKENYAKMSKIQYGWTL